MDSIEFTEWMAFDRFEPIGSRTVPDLLALLTTAYINRNSKPNARALLPQDILDDPLLPRRLDPAEEARRTAKVAGDYRRLRAERLAKRELARTEAERGASA